MSRICAWCNSWIEMVAAARQAPPSHGICKACLRRQLESIPSEPRVRAA